MPRRALGQALADSIPILVVTAVASRDALGRRLGQLHELPDQQAAARSFCRASFRLDDPATLPTVLAAAWHIFYCERPGPVHIEVPLDVLTQPVAATVLSVPPMPRHPEPLSTEQRHTLETFAGHLSSAEHPALLLGGGAVRLSVEQCTELAEVLDAPVATTVNGKGLVPAGHPLALGSSPSAPTVAKLLSDSDVVLAIGTEFGETDYDLLMTEPFTLRGRLLRIDIDPEQLARNAEPDLGLAAPAELAVPALLETLKQRPNARRDGQARTIAARSAYTTEPHYHPDFAHFFDLLNTVVPEAIVVGDSTRPDLLRYLAVRTVGASSVLPQRQRVRHARLCDPRRLSAPALAATGLCWR